MCLLSSHLFKDGLLSSLGSSIILSLSHPPEFYYFLRVSIYTELPPCGHNYVVITVKK